jgi:hypothetical protein
MDGSKSEKKQRSGFFAFLNCCGGGSDMEDTEGSSLPSKKTAIVPTNQQRIAKPTEKLPGENAAGDTRRSTHSMRRRECRLRPSRQRRYLKRVIPTI